MALTFWTDPHLGLNRTSHTTPQSRKALREALYKQALWMVGKPSNPSICLGDLFDTTDNEEAVIAQGAEVASRCSLILAGNHDLGNRDGKMSSLQLIGELAKDSAIALEDATDTYFQVQVEGVDLFCIPHKRTQEIFDATLLNIQSAIRINPEAIILLHCNYDNSFASDETSLNLSKSQAAQLVADFDYVLIGHEHIPRSDFGGRLQILGNIHPTSFSDISDKFIWAYEKGELRKEKIWSADKYLLIRWEELLSSGISKIDLEFIEITGTAPASKLPEISKAVQKLWAQFPTAYMIRNHVKSEAIVVDVPTQHKALDVPAQITAELQGSKLLPLWTKYLEAL